MPRTTTAASWIFWSGLQRHGVSEHWVSPELDLDTARRLSQNGNARGHHLVFVGARGGRGAVHGRDDLILGVEDRHGHGDQAVVELVFDGCAALLADPRENRAQRRLRSHGLLGERCEPRLAEVVVYHF